MNKNDKSSKEIETSERMAFHKVDAVFEGLHTAFLNDMEEHDDVDQRFLGLWWSFLAMVGWTEDQYWEAVESLDDGNCPDCGEPMTDHEDETDEEMIKNNVVSLPTGKKNELN